MINFVKKPLSLPIVTPKKTYLKNRSAQLEQMVHANV